VAKQAPLKIIIAIIFEIMAIILKIMAIIYLIFFSYSPRILPVIRPLLSVVYVIGCSE